MIGPDARLKRFLANPHEERADASPTELGRYRITRRVGSGGFAVVYEAQDTKLRRRVALKAIRLDEPNAPALSRLEQEAGIAAQLHHPNIVGIHEAGIARDRSGQLFYTITMDFVDGGTLAGLLREQQTPLSELLRMLEEIARAVAYAHSHRVIHRDLKPANVLVEKSGRVLLTDFGLAKDLSRNATKLTKAGDIFGTPEYMAPEQVTGKTAEIDARTDVYALGIMLYEILAGRTPFRADAPHETCRQILQEEAPRPSERNRSVSPDLEVICLKAMEKKPMHRYPGALDFAEDLSRFRRGKPILARPISMAARLLRSVVRYRAIVVPSAVACAALLVLPAWLLFGATNKSRRIRASLAEAARWENAGNVDRARDGYKSVLDLDGDDVQARAGFERMEGARRRRAAIRESEEQLAAVEKTLEKMRRLPSGQAAEDPETQRILAEAERSLLEVAQRTPDLPRANLASGQVLEAKGDVEGAVTRFSEAIRLDPRLTQAYRNRGALLLRKEDPAGAIADYTEVLRLEPDDFDALLARGSARRRTGEVDLAIADLTEAIRVNGKSPTAFARRGMARQDADDLPGAKKDMEQALALAPAQWSAREAVERRLTEVVRKLAREK